MIKKISKLKNFGIFHDFSWKTDLPEFKKFNLIYGWNRSGKTTISRVFASCEKRCSYDKDKFRQYPENGEFELITHDETIVKNTDLATNVLPVKVFNQDFIDDNISFDPSTPCNPIVYISEEDIDSKKQLEKLGLDKITLGKIYEEAKKDRSIKEEEKNTFLIGLGREIANILFDKTYNKTKVENRIDTIGIDNFSDKVLPDDDKKKYEEISKSDARKNQTVLTNYRLSFSFEEEIVDSFKKIYEVAEKLLSKKVISETIDRLRDDQSLNNWVKQGFDLHKSKNEKGNCLFCRKPLDTDFLDNLAKHFSKDYEELQNAINRLKNEISKVKAIVIAVNNDELYPDLKDNYTNKAKELNDCIDKINVWIDSVVEKLVEKYNNPLVTVASPEKPEDFLITYDQHIAEINKIIFNHNEKAKNHAFEVTSAREKLELNSIAVALSEQDYKKMGSGIKESEKKEKEALEAINMNNFEISELEKKTSNIGKAIKDINKHLKEFFGREEIKLELDGDKKGYIIRRDKQPAKNLSEGEKTAIAFSYFIVKVKEKEFDIKNSTIVIDDPISSFDANFIYHAYSLIKTYFQEAGQLIVSTHNFHLFNLLKDWFIGKNSQNWKDNAKIDKENTEIELSGGTLKDRKPTPCEFFMVDNFFENDARNAKIVPLDNTLKKFKSEYHFLFFKLKEFSDNEDAEYADFYTVGNIARRFFDIYADFKIPNTGDPKSKMDVLISYANKEKEVISPVEAEKAFKLINEFSHNFDPTSIIEHRDNNESKQAIKILLNIIRQSDPNHYKILESNLV